MTSVDLVQFNYFKFILDDLSSKGVNINNHLKNAELFKFDLSDPQNYLPVSLMYKLFRNLKTEEGIVDFVSELQTSIRVANLYNYGEFMLSAPDLLTAASLSINYANLNYSSEVDGMKISGPFTEFSIDLTDQHRPGKEHAYEMNLALIIDHIKLACGDNWSPEEIYYPVQQVPDLSRLLPNNSHTRVVPGADKLSVVFRTNILGRKIGFQGQAHKEYDPAVTFSLNSSFISEKIEHLLNRYLGYAPPTISYLANILDIPQRTLQRRLATEGTSYSAIVEKWRFNKSLELIHQPHLKISEISERLGYLKEESFYRAFRRWMNCSPAEFRAQL